MGVALTPITVKQSIELEHLRGKRLAIDGNGELYQFLALIRMHDGTPLHDAAGRVTSHLSGLFYRTTRLIADYALQPVFVFDGVPPALKSAELARRRATRERYEEEVVAARAAGDLARAYSKATMTSRLTRDMVGEALHLLRLMGIPAFRAPSEAEAQAAHMARSNAVWAAASKDFDSLLFGTPRLVRFLTISGKEYLPSRGAFRAITPELIELDHMLATLDITREQLVDVAILVGTDFNTGVKGIGPKKALKLIHDHGSIERLSGSVRETLEPTVVQVRNVFLEPEVTDEYSLETDGLDVEGVIQYLCTERSFSEDRVTAALRRAFAV